MYSMDSNYILSGSDDTNIRLWKAHASTPIGVVRRSPRLSVSRDCTFVLVHCSLALVCCYQLHPRQRQKLNYNSALKQRYGHLPEIKRIARYVGAATSWLHHCILFSLTRSLSLSLSLSLALSFPSTNTRHRHVPKSIKLAQAEKHIRKLSKARRERNALANSKPGSIPARVGERQRAIIAQEE
jgi:DDB1- and CUL4-associated factor 13